MFYEYDDRAAPQDSRCLIVNGKRYFHKTTAECKTCSQPDRYLYVKQKLDNDWILECPYCESVTPVKSITVTLAK